MLPLPHLSHSTLPKPPPRTFTTGPLPPSLDPAQPPTKKQPFAALRAQRWVSSLDVVLPAELAEIVGEELQKMEARYAKVIMKVGDVLDGELFTEGIKRGNIMVMSEGRKGVDNRFELFDGTLRIELDKATYERAGLQGKPMRDGGLKHKINRYAIEIDLRQPSMLHGKKGFERILWACKNVFDLSLTWLFCIRSEENRAAVEKALEKHHPRWLTSRATTTHLPGVDIPALRNLTYDAATDVEYATELEEWLSLVVLESPRVLAVDRPNEFICRYAVPRQDTSETGADGVEVADLTLFRWRGFLPAVFVVEVLVKVKEGVGERGWWGLRARGVGGEGDVVSVLQVLGDAGEGPEYMCWSRPS